MKLPLNYLFIVCLLFLNACSDDDVRTDDTSLEETTLSTPDEIFRLVNMHRESIGLSPLEKNETAEQMAIDHTNYMISIGEANHDGFEERAMILNAQENALSTAENVAQFFPNAASVVNGWLESGGHRDNIEGNFTHTGIAAVLDEQGRYYYTQIFYR